MEVEDLILPYFLLHQVLFHKREQCCKKQNTRHDEVQRMKSKPISSTPGNSAILHIKTSDTNGIVSYVSYIEGSKLSKARPGPVLPIWETTSQWGLGSLAEAVEEEEKPTGWAEPPEQAVTLYPVIATPSVLSLTLVTTWVKKLSHCLTSRAWQGLDKQQREMLTGETWGCPTGMSELSREYSAVTHGEHGQRDKNVRGTGMAQFTRQMCKLAQTQLAVNTPRPEKVEVAENHTEL